MRQSSHRTPKKSPCEENRRLFLEALESRKLMAALPYGATANDTGEFFLGRIAVTPVLLESTGDFDPSTENWRSEHQAQVVANLQDGLEWWNDLLDTKTTIHNLDFVIDDSYVLSPSPTVYEPINRVSNDYDMWVPEFLTRAGYSEHDSIDDNMRAFNNAQRIKYDADWAFTIFIVNSENDGEGTFASGGSFSRAFAFAGGLYFVIPSSRPASTYAHETGHMFWARDEYSGGGNYLQRRGYYNTQNLNAIDLNPTPGFQQSTSIMSAGIILQNAYDQVVSPDSTLAMVGWQDSDGDGIFDVLDVPLVLDGVGIDKSDGSYRFRGKAKVDTLPNLNASGLQNDITLNQISRIEYRINGGTWVTFQQPNVYEKDLDLTIPLGGTTAGTIEFRAVDQVTGISSNVFQGTLGTPFESTSIVGIQGFVWNDADEDATWDSSESSQAGWTVQLVDGNGQPLNLQSSVEADSQPSGDITSNVFPGVTLSVLGDDATGKLGVFFDADASTGSQVFRPFSSLTQSYRNSWRAGEHQLRIDFSALTSLVSVDVIGATAGSFGRLEIYDASGRLLDRVTSDSLGIGESQTIKIGRSQADISYAVVRAQGTTAIKIDNIKYGPETTTKTDSLGRYAFTYIPAGEYRVKLVDRSNFTVTTDVVQTVQFNAGAFVEHVDFGAKFEGSPWHNFNFAEDVNSDNQVTPLDALLIINLLNQGGARPLTGSGLATTPLIDVSGDTTLAPIDALIVINYLNQQVNGEGENGSGSQPGGPNGEANGEANYPNTPLSADTEIYAEWGRYEGPAGPTTEPASFVERLTSPTWKLSKPCNCAYCQSFDENS